MKFENRFRADFAASACERKRPDESDCAESV